ncbi:MAG TPA: hypothetical protein VF717_16905 [Pyrinomonadaceae bacterium]
MADRIHTGRGAIDDPQNNRRPIHRDTQERRAHMHHPVDDILELSAIEAGAVTLATQAGSALLAGERCHDDPCILRAGLERGPSQPGGRSRSRVSRSKTP